ncbi:Txe/YoeB family addiction module toxin [Streptomyces somaliensis]|uniref:Txe/YoeB family addiction module toxin n=1 Tax=Streptomyces somaliensis TaxID=78355 RepID=UPI0020CD63D1|nr:Txe/YoeB family addiction module toxin [Streptomyces somaliensis]MCP9944941.1 Txe/YoeB family addiction module toxin [Streptomyces somaliensis]MCP9961836.1 Txe/YoeB family addiction module toxin [Streptomyces somaliensis]MCP9974657.1 Txe/YoeB family addiction module toxin [Streptomyces somaliensis]
MKKLFSPTTWEQYTHWATADPKILKKTNRLIKDIERTPFEGIGKPEPLKGNLSGWWSRRITDEHRLVYRVHDDRVEIALARYHHGA